MPPHVDPSNRPVARPLLFVALTAVVLGWVVGCSSAPAATPPSSTATPAASADPADDGATNVVPLHSATGSEISVDIVDASGLLVGAESGTPGDGATVEPYELTVTNDDPTTLRLVWAGGPCDSVDALSIDEAARSILLVEPDCPSDAVAFDRILVLHFDSPVPAEDVRAVLQDGLDTPG